MDRKLGVVIAVRQLRGEGPRPKVVTVKLGKPRRSKKDWECPFSINGLKIRGIRFRYGVDAIQALYLALEGIGVILARSGARLTWIGGQLGDTGFNRLVPSYFGPKFSRKLSRMIDREVERFARASTMKHRRLPKTAPE